MLGYTHHLQTHVLSHTPQYNTQSIGSAGDLCEAASRVWHNNRHGDDQVINQPDENNNVRKMLSLSKKDFALSSGWMITLMLSSSWIILRESQLDKNISLEPVTQA
jgi:hypothetical protein